MPWDPIGAPSVTSLSTDTAHCKSAQPGPHQLLPGSGSSGFHLSHWKKKWFLEAREPASHVAIHLDPGIWVWLFYWRSKILGLGKALCWFEGDNSTAQVLDGYWEQPFNMPEYVTGPAIRSLWLC